MKIKSVILSMLMLVALVSLTSASAFEAEKEVKNNLLVQRQCGQWSGITIEEGEEGPGKTCQLYRYRNCWEAVVVGYTLEVHYTTEYQLVGSAYNCP